MAPPYQIHEMKMQEGRVGTLLNKTLQIEVSAACNLDCGICLRRKQERKDTYISLSSFKEILDSCRFRYVGLHGWGEPLLNGHVFQMVEYARSKGVITNLTTNGTLLEARTDEILRSGLEEIAFGVYDPELFSNVIPAIEKFLRERNGKGIEYPRAYLDITLYRENREKIPDLIRAASDMGIESIILHRLFDLYDRKPGALSISNADEKALFREIKRLARSRGIRLFLPKRHSYPCLIVKRSLFVTVDGAITPCTYLTEEFMGDAFQGELPHVFKSRRYRDFVRNMRQHSVCGRCRW